MRLGPEFNYPTCEQTEPRFSQLVQHLLEVDRVLISDNDYRLLEHRQLIARYERKIIENKVWQLLIKRPDPNDPYSRIESMPEYAKITNAIGLNSDGDFWVVRISINGPLPIRRVEFNLCPELEDLLREFFRTKQ